MPFSRFFSWVSSKRLGLYEQACLYSAKTVYKDCVSNEVVLSEKKGRVWFYWTVMED